jgi:hypothetical protein
MLKGNVALSPALFVGGLKCKKKTFKKEKKKRKMDRRRKKVFFHCPSIIFRSVQHKFSLGGLSLKQIQFSSIYEWNSYQTLVSLSLCLFLCIFRIKLSCSLVYLYICYFEYLVPNTHLSYFFVCFFVNIIPKTLLSIFMSVCLYITYSTQCLSVPLCFVLSFSL